MRQPRKSLKFVRPYNIDFGGLSTMKMCVYAQVTNQIASNVAVEGE